MANKIKMEDLGYDDFFAANRSILKLDHYAIGRVMAEYKGAYKVINTNGEHLAKITGKQIFNALSREDYPAVGDWVAISELAGGQAVIRKILPRKTIIKRKSSHTNETQIIATNIDVAFIVESVDKDYSLNRFERYFVITRDGGVKPVIILNKIDLISEPELENKLLQIKNRFPDIEVILTSTISNEGLNELSEYIKGGVSYSFLGSSGVGKSSLINKLLGEDIIKTEVLSARNGRGKHATTNRAMYFLGNGGIVIDNPGLREVGMTDVNEGIDNSFDEIARLAKQCKYADCTHVHEPGCEVLSALKSNKLDEHQYNNYLSLKKEAEYYEQTEQQRRDKDRKFGRFVKNAKKQIKEIKP